MEKNNSVKTQEGEFEVTQVATSTSAAAQQDDGEFQVTRAGT